MVQFRYGTKEAFLESLLREEYETRLLRTEPDPGMTGLQRVLAQIAHQNREERAAGDVRGVVAGVVQQWRDRRGHPTPDATRTDISIVPQVPLLNLLDGDPPSQKHSRPRHPRQSGSAW